MPTNIATSQQREKQKNHHPKCIHIAKVGKSGEKGIKIIIKQIKTVHAYKMQIQPIRAQYGRLQQRTNTTAKVMANAKKTFSMIFSLLTRDFSK
jgi:hypothetical protein